MIWYGALGPTTAGSNLQFPMQSLIEAQHAASNCAPGRRGDRGIVAVLQNGAEG